MLKIFLSKFTLIHLSEVSSVAYSTILVKFNSEGEYEYTSTIKSSGQFFVTAAAHQMDSCFIAFGYGDSTANYQFDPYGWGICKNSTGFGEVNSESNLIAFANLLSIDQQLTFENLPEGSWELSTYSVLGKHLFTMGLNPDQSVSVARYFTPGLYLIVLRNKVDESERKVFKLVVTPTR